MGRGHGDHVSLHLVETQRSGRGLDPCSPRSVNVFQGGQTYYVYFLFAKTSTKETYQIYVGPGFTANKGYNPSNPTGTSLTAVRADLTVLPLQKFTTIAWPTAWEVSYTPVQICANAQPGDGCGVLQVTIDMSNQTDLLPISSTAVSPGLCKPEKFCTASGTTCGCALSSTDPLFSQCTKACGQWAVKDVDFPDAGAYGFSVTLPQNFSADDNGAFHRRSPQNFNTQTVEPSFNWLATLLLDNSTVPANGTSCLYSKVPGTPSCK